MIGVLEEERWKELEHIFEKNWNADLPTRGNAYIIAEWDDAGAISSFVVCEQLVRIGQIHSEGGNPRGLLRWVEANMPEDVSVIAVTHERRDRKICEHLKMYPMNQGVVYRRDF
jgi:hypothetical protein